MKQGFAPPDLASTHPSGLRIITSKHHQHTNTSRNSHRTATSSSRRNMHNLSRRSNQSDDFQKTMHAWQPWHNMQPLLNTSATTELLSPAHACDLQPTLGCSSLLWEEEGRRLLVYVETLAGIHALIGLILFVWARTWSEDVVCFLCRVTVLCSEWLLAWEIEILW